MKLLEAISNFICFWNKASIKYRKISGDEEKRAKSKYFGRSSMIYGIIGFVFVALALWGVSAILEHFSNMKLGDGQADFPFFSLVGLIFCALVAVTCFIKCTVYSLVLMRYQFRMNKLSIRWAALVMWFVCIIAEIVVAILLFV